MEKIGKHDPNAGLKGGKYSLLEAGTRVPFITYWKGRIQPGVSDALISQLDLIASLATLVGGENNTLDSKDLLPVLFGESKVGREALILEATSRTALRKGDWVMIPPYNGKAVNENVNIELGNSSEYQLYNIKEDQGQEHNLASLKPEKLEEMQKYYESVINSSSTSK